MQISIMEISMSLNGNLGLLWGITQPTEKILLLLSKTFKIEFKFAKHWKVTHTSPGAYA